MSKVSESLEQKSLQERLDDALALQAELVTALNGALVALKLGAHVDVNAAYIFGSEVLAKAKADK